MIEFLLRYWKPFAGIGAAIVIMGLFIAYQDNQITALRKERNEALASVANHEKALEALQTDSNAKIKALETERNNAVKRTQDQGRLLGHIKGASDDENGTVSPVLRDTLERLYGRTSNEN